MNKNQAVNLAKKEWAKEKIEVVNDLQKKGGGRQITIKKGETSYFVSFIHKNQSGSLIHHIKPEYLEQLENADNKGHKPALSINFSYSENGYEYLIMATYTIDQLRKLITDTDFYPISIETKNILFRYQNTTSREQLIKSADINGTILQIE